MRAQSAPALGLTATWLRMRHCIRSSLSATALPLGDRESAKHVSSVIARSGAGLDNLDTDAAARRKIPVLFSPGMNSRTVAEHTLALMLNLLRRITPWANAAASGRWEERGRYQGDELAGLTLGIIGYGNIGKRVAFLANAFGMKVVVAERGGTAITGEYSTLPLEEVLSIADVVTLHLPLTNETKGILSAERLKLMRPSACIINTVINFSLGSTQ